MIGQIWNEAFSSNQIEVFLDFENLRREKNSCLVSRLLRDY